MKYTTTSNNSKDEYEDYRFDAERNDSLKWGKRSTTLFFINIVKTSVALAQEDLDHLASLQQRYYVEMLNSLVISKESD